MNRNEEFEALLEELNETPVRGGDISRALARLRQELEKAEEALHEPE